MKKTQFIKTANIFTSYIALSVCILLIEFECFGYGILDPVNIGNQKFFCDPEYPITISNYYARVSQDGALSKTNHADRWYLFHFEPPACEFWLAGLWSYRAGNYTNAFREFQHAATNDDADAQYALSVMYANGQGTETNLLESDNWLLKAARMPSAAAAAITGIEALQKDETNGSSLLLRAHLNDVLVAAIYRDSAAIKTIKRYWESAAFGVSGLVVAVPYTTNMSELWEAERIAPLAGIEKIRLNISLIGDYAKSDGMDESTLQTAVELRLRAAGIKIAPVPEIEFPMLHVRVVCFKAEKNDPSYAVTVRVALDARVLYRFNRFFAEIWSDDTLGVVGSQRIEAVKDWTANLVDRFANDYLKANPKN